MAILGNLTNVTVTGSGLKYTVGTTQTLSANTLYTFPADSSILYYVVDNIPNGAGSFGVLDSSNNNLLANGSNGMVVGASGYTSRNVSLMGGGYGSSYIAYPGDKLGGNQFFSSVYRITKVYAA